jgi:hypothetical protein
MKSDYLVMAYLGAQLAMVSFSEIKTLQWLVVATLLLKKQLFSQGLQKASL